MKTHPSLRVYDRILVPVDESEESARALPVGRVLAKLLGTTVHLVHVTEERLTALEARTRLSFRPKELSGAILRTREGDPVAEIVKEAAGRERAFVVMATHGARKPARGLGHVAEGILRKVGAPLVLVPPNVHLREWMPRRILLPQDGNPDSAAALCPAIGLAEAAGASITVLHIPRAGTAAAPDPGQLTVPQYVDQPHHEWPGWTREFLERVRGLCGLSGTLKMRFKLIHGDPGDAILRAARDIEADLVVLPWRGRWEPGRASILKAVLRDPPCPLLVVLIGSDR